MLDWRRGVIGFLELRADVDLVVVGRAGLADSLADLAAAAASVFNSGTGT